MVELEGNLQVGGTGLLRWSRLARMHCTLHTEATAPVPEAGEAAAAPNSILPIDRLCVHSAHAGS